jgi:hypothetical protein
MNVEREVGKLTKTTLEIASYPVKSTLGVVFEANKRATEELISEKVRASYLVGFLRRVHPKV